MIKGRESYADELVETRSNANFSIGLHSYITVPV